MIAQSQFVEKGTDSIQNIVLSFGLERFFVSFPTTFTVFAFFKYAEFASEKLRWTNTQVFVNPLLQNIGRIEADMIRNLSMYDLNRASGVPFVILNNYRPTQF